MLKVKQFRYGADNLGYLIYGVRDALVIDGGAYREMLDFIEKKNLNLLYLTNTHDHYDHTSGNRDFIGHHKRHILKYEDLIKEGEIKLEGRKIKIYNTPGHTEDSVCFHVDNMLISGDTLFNGTIGNCFTGDLNGFFQSIRKIVELPVETIVYAGHDYVHDAMSYAKNLEPGNKEIDVFLRRYDPGHVFSTLEDEFRVNPFLRFNDESIIKLLKKKNLPSETEWDRWHSLMSID